LHRPPPDHQGERRHQHAGHDAEDAEDQREGGPWVVGGVGPVGGGGRPARQERAVASAGVKRPTDRAAAAVAVAVARCSWCSIGGQAFLPVVLLAASLALSATSSPAALALSATSAPA